MHLRYYNYLQNINNTLLYIQKRFSMEINLYLLTYGCTMHCNFSYTNLCSLRLYPCILISMIILCNERMHACAFMALFTYIYLLQS